MTDMSPASRPELMLLPSGHYLLDATALSLQDLTLLARSLHQGCATCQVVFLTSTSSQVFSMAAGTDPQTPGACTLVSCHGSG